MKIYRTSRGIKQPEVIKDITEDDVSSVVGNLPLLYEVSYELKLEDDNSKYKNVIQYKQYNKTIKTEKEKEKRQKKLNNKKH